MHLFISAEQLDKEVLAYLVEFAQTFVIDFKLVVVPFKQELAATHLVPWRELMTRKHQFTVVRVSD